MKMLLFLFLTLFSIQIATATHLKGGFIQAKAVSGSALTYEVTLTLYLDEIRGSTAASQADSYVICFGDGTSATAYRTSRLLIADKSMSINSYRINHTYAGPGTYTLTSSIANRTTVQNITNADGMLFTLSTTFSTNTTGLNQTPTPGFPPSGFYLSVNRRTLLLLKAVDSEGDSLVYSLARPLTSTSSESCTRQVVSSYQFPNDLTRQGTFKLGNRNGDLVWESPTQSGSYSIAINISEYRNGLLISQTTQEIVLVVTDLPGTPGPISPYEPAIEGSAVVTGITPYSDSDVVLSVFPGPVDDRLQVVIQSSNPVTATVILTDLNGRKLHELAFSKAARQHEQLISIDSLTPGIYLLRADVRGISLVRKIVKR